MGILDKLFGRKKAKAQKIERAGPIPPPTTGKKSEAVPERIIKKKEMSKCDKGRRSKLQKERGKKKFPPGFVKRKIVLAIAHQFPQSVEESSLRYSLRKYGIGKQYLESRNIRKAEDIPTP